MPSTLPITIRISPFPETGDWTPQQFAEEIANRISLESQQSVAVFQTGSQLPSSDQGPYLLNGVEWWVWDISTGSYQPLTIQFQSLKYIAQVAPPDHNIYTIWYVLNSAGKALDIRYYYSGNWVSIFEDKFAEYLTATQTNTAIDTAVNLKYSVLAVPSADQTVAVDGTFHKLDMSAENLDPNGVYDAAQSRYVAPVNGIYRVSYSLQVNNDTGTASGMEIHALVMINGSFPTKIISGTSVSNPPGSRWYPVGSGIVILNATDFIELTLRAQDGVLSGNVTNSVNSSWSIELVQKT